MKRVPMLMLLIMAFVSFATVNSFADNSPPGVEISINYEMPEGAQINVEIQVAQVWQVIEMNNDEDRITVPDCDLKCWPSNENSINIYNSKNIARINYMYDDAFIRTADLAEALYTNNSQTIKDEFNTQERSSSVDKNEVLSLFEHSKGDRYSARNAII